MLLYILIDISSKCLDPFVFNLAGNYNWFCNGHSGVQRLIPETWPSMVIHRVSLFWCSGPAICQVSWARSYSLVSKVVQWLGMLNYKLELPLKSLIFLGKLMTLIWGISCTFFIMFAQSNLRNILIATQYEKRMVTNDDILERASQKGALIMTETAREFE